MVQPVEPSVLVVVYDSDVPDFAVNVVTSLNPATPLPGSPLSMAPLPVMFMLALGLKVSCVPPCVVKVTRLIVTLLVAAEQPTPAVTCTRLNDRLTIPVDGRLETTVCEVSAVPKLVGALDCPAACPNGAESIEPPVTVGVVIVGLARVLFCRVSAPLSVPVVVGPVIVGDVRVLLVSVWESVSPTIALAGAVSPLWSCAFRFGTTVVLAMLSGAVPVATVLVICFENELAPVQLLLSERNCERLEIGSGAAWA